MTAISDTRDLTTLTTTTLFGKLREHEFEMTRLKEMETVEKKSKSLALKTKVADIESNEESSDECSHTENLNIDKEISEVYQDEGQNKGQDEESTK